MIRQTDMIFFKNVFLFGPLFDFLYEKILFNSQNSRTRKNFQNRDSEFNFLKFLDPVHRRNFIRVAKNPSSWFSSTSKTKSKKFRKKSKFWCKHHFWTKISEKLMEKVHIFKNDHFKYLLSTNCIFPRSWNTHNFSQNIHIWLISSNIKVLVANQNLGLISD